MLKCLAIDDEPLALRQIEKYIEKLPYLELVAACTNALEAQQLLTSQAIDLLFVDINMPDLNGVDLVRSLPKRPLIIFTTAYSEYAIEGFRLDAVDYLLKPFSFADFSRAAAKANTAHELQQLQQQNLQAAQAEPAPTATEQVGEGEPSAPSGEGEQEYISVKADYKVSLIRTSEIVYIESEGEYVRIHMQDGSKITTLYRIKNMEAQLPAARFMRVHRSYIVNLQAIKSYVRGRIYLSDKDFIPIAKGAMLIFSTHYAELLDEFERNDNIYIVRNRGGITAENLSVILKRNDIKKSEAYQSGFLEGTVPMYDSYMALKNSLIRSHKEDE